MFWRIIIGLFKCRAKDYLKTVRLGSTIFIIDIHKYISAEDELEQWKNALKKGADVSE